MATGATGWISDKLDNIGVSGSAGGTLNGSGVWIDPSNNLFGDINSCVIDKWKETRDEPSRLSDLFQVIIQKKII